MNKVILICIFCASTLGFNYGNASVVVKVADVNFSFEQPPYLTEVLSSINNIHETYWSSASLFKKKGIEFQKRQLKILEQLTNVIQKNQKHDSDVPNALENLKNTVSGWKLAHRVPIKIDYDLARIKPAANPRLTSGEYILSLKPRSSSVLVLGAIKQTTSVHHQPFTDVSEYILSNTLLSNAEKDFVFIIQADGRMIKSPTAYWNKKHQEVMPGSLIFVPFKETLFNQEVEKLNRDIVLLAQNRVPV